MASVAAAFCRLTPQSRTHSGALFQRQDLGRVRVKREETDNFDRLQVKGVESYPSLDRVRFETGREELTEVSTVAVNPDLLGGNGKAFLHFKDPERLPDSLSELLRLMINLLSLSCGCENERRGTEVEARAGGDN
ncbi:hypothetical protein NQZ68_019731 [Dissostichus eleginoides]|nr:hypothetical protein NQZ68_019731 [Dissostichus eleginoides]